MDGGFDERGSAGDDGVEVERGGVDDDCAGRAGERGGGAGGVEAVAFGDGVGLAFGGTALGAGRGVGGEEKAEGGVGKDDGADVAAFHDEAGRAMREGDRGLGALVVEEEAADGGKRGEAGDVGVHGFAAEVGIGGDFTGEGKAGGAAGDLGGERELGEGGGDGGGVVRRDAGAEEGEGDGAVVGAGVDVEEVEARGEGAGEGGLAGGGAAVNGDDEEGRGSGRHGEKIYRKAGAKGAKEGKRKTKEELTADYADWRRGILFNQERSKERSRMDTKESE